VREEDVVGCCGELGRNERGLLPADLYKLGGELPEGVGRMSGVSMVVAEVLAASVTDEASCCVARFPD
jgi:hypothetical protein